MEKAVSLLSTGPLQPVSHIEKSKILRRDKEREKEVMNEGEAEDDDDEESDEEEVAEFTRNR